MYFNQLIDTNGSIKTIKNVFQSIIRYQLINQNNQSKQTIKTIINQSINQNNQSKQAINE